MIEADRHYLKDCLKNYHFDVAIDTGYTVKDINFLLDASNGYGSYVFISSSVVYPEYIKQLFKEVSRLGENKF